MRKLRLAPFQETANLNYAAFGSTGANPMLARDNALVRPGAIDTGDVRGAYHAAMTAFYKNAQQRYGTNTVSQKLDQIRARHSAVRHVVAPSASEQPKAIMTSKGTVPLNGAAVRKAALARPHRNYKPIMANPYNGDVIRVKKEVEAANAVRVQRAAEQRMDKIRAKFMAARARGSHLRPE